jgi:hypothetical protein
VQYKHKLLDLDRRINRALKHDKDKIGGYMTRIEAIESRNTKVQTAIESLDTTTAMLVATVGMTMVALTMLYIRKPVNIVIVTNMG